jgi:hypothetical protein
LFEELWKRALPSTSFGRRRARDRKSSPSSASLHLEANGSQAVHGPEARKMNVDELIDNRFVKELDDSGFVKALYGGK